MKRSKRYNSNAEKIVHNKSYSLKEGIELLKKSQTAKFDETVDISIRLGVDPKKADQMIRGTVALPHGTGKKVRVLVFCKSPKDKEAKDAGADMVGFDEYIEKIKKGWSDMDAVVATPDVMKDVGKLGKFLGPRGLMPNPKAGTVTFEVGDAVSQLKAGRIEFRVDKQGIINTAVGKMSFSADNIGDNIHALMDQIMRLKPVTVKGRYLLNVALSSSMGPGIHLDESTVLKKE